VILQFGVLRPKQKGLRMEPVIENQVPDPLPTVLIINKLIGLQIGPVTVFPARTTHQRALSWSEMAPHRVVERIIQCNNTFRETLDVPEVGTKQRENPRIELLLFLHTPTAKERRYLTQCKRRVQALLDQYCRQEGIDPYNRPTRR
jgi:hypothetical protein